MSEQIKTEITAKEVVVKTEKVVISGDGIAGLFPDPSSEVVEVEYKNQILKFEVMPMDNETFAQIGDKIKLGNINLEDMKGSLAGMKLVSDLYWPALKVVLPICCISPRMIDGISTDKAVISVNRIKLEVGIELLDKIMAMSGLGEEKAENRKK